MGSQVPAAQQTLQVLRHLATRRGPVSAAQIAAALDLPRSTTYHLLRVMQDEGFVVHLPEERLYGLGLRAFELSSAYVRQAPLARLGHPLLRGLVDRVGESAHLAVLHGRDVVYVVEERASRRPSLVSDVGVRLPAHLTASGRAMLSVLDAAQVRALYPDRAAFVARGDGPAWSARRLRAELQATRSRAHAVEDGDITQGLSSVAVPTLDHLGLPAAAVALTFPTEAVDEDRRAALADEARAVADQLARRLRGL